MPEPIKLQLNGVELTFHMSRLGGTFQERKAERKEHFEKYVKGWKLVPCTACNGSGRYDHNGSPKCSSCNGTGKERVRAI